MKVVTISKLLVLRQVSPADVMEGMVAKLTVV